MLGACQRAKESRPETRNTSQRRRRRHMSTKATGPGGEGEHRTTLGASTLLSIDDELPGIQILARCQACRPLTARPGYMTSGRPGRPPPNSTSRHTISRRGITRGRYPQPRRCSASARGRGVEHAPPAPASPFIRESIYDGPGIDQPSNQRASRRSAHSLLNSFVNTGINLLTSDDRPH